MRFAEVKSIEQQSVLAMHKLRASLIRHRTRVGNSIINDGLAVHAIGFFKRSRDLRGLLEVGVEVTLSATVPRTSTSHRTIAAAVAIVRSALAV